MIPIRYNLRSLAVRKATTLATASGVALVVFVLAAALMLVAGIRRTLGRSAQADNAIVLRTGSDAELGSVIDASAVPLVLATPGVARGEDGRSRGAGEVVVVAAMEKVGASGRTNVTLRGTDDTGLSIRSGMRVVAGRAPMSGRDEAMVGTAIRGRIRGTDVGQTFEVKKNRPVTIVGAFEANGSSYESEVWVDRELLRQVFHRDGVVSSVRVGLESPAKFDAFRMAVESDRRLGLRALRETTYYEGQSDGTAIFVATIGTTIAVFFAFGATIGVMITMHGAVSSRTREIGILRALGFSRSSVLTSFVLESMLLAAAGGAVGALASLALGLVRFSMINFANWSEVVFSFDATANVIETALVFACGMGIVGGVVPALRAARTSPLDAVRG